MNNKDNFDAFDILASELSNTMHDVTDEELEVINQQKKTSDTDEVDEEPELEDETPSTEDTVEEDEEEVVETKTTTKKETKETTDETDDLGEYEEDIAKLVAAKLGEKLGVTLGEFTKVDDIVDELASMVEESTKDAFANDEIVQLNEYVRNGGDLKKFYAETFNAGVDLDLIDIDSASDQKKIVKENLLNRGYSDKQIERMISRYQDSGVLQEEAEDSIESIKEFRETKKKALLETQQKQADTVKKRNERYFSDVQKSIKELNNVYGINLSDKDRKDLYTHVLVPEADGKTKFQKDTFEDPKKFVVAAFLAMKGSTLIDKAQSKGATITAKTLKDKLSQKGNRVKKSGTRDEGIDALDWFSGKLRKN